MDTFTFRISKANLEEMKKYQDENWSDILRRSVEIKLAEILAEKHRKEEAEKGLYRTFRYKNNSVTINAKTGRFGPTDWELVVNSDLLKEPTKVSLGGMGTELDRIIRGVSDYHYNEYLKNMEIDLSKALTREALFDLWLSVGKWAKDKAKDKIVQGFANIALLPSERFDVHGLLNNEDFVGKVIPKSWGDVKIDAEEINVFNSNLWMTSGGNFRLSSYLAEMDGLASAKSATRYIDFNPGNLQHANEIKMLISKAKVVYLPDLSVKGVRAIIY